MDRVSHRKTRQSRQLPQPGVSVRGVSGDEYVRSFEQLADGSGDNVSEGWIQAHEGCPIPIPSTHRLDITLVVTIPEQGDHRERVSIPQRDARKMGKV